MRLGSRQSFCGPSLHGCCKKLIDFGPRRSCFRRESVIQPLLEGPQKRVADEGVVFCFGPIRCMPRAEILDDRRKRRKIVQLADTRCKHGHELALLVAEIVGKQDAQIRSNGEQPVVEELSNDILHRSDEREARAHQHDIPRR